MGSAPNGVLYVNECPCVRYVGPLSSYVPELDGEPAFGELNSKEG